MSQRAPSASGAVTTTDTDVRPHEIATLAVGDVGSGALLSVPTSTGVATLSQLRVSLRLKDSATPAELIKFTCTSAVAHPADVWK